ncbi:MAG: multidrug resistance efflux pump-like protein [Firmicutes bacterium]|nr:multidrug resistance efflux pump-like protein [Bacillota bacterium]
MKVSFSSNKRSDSTIENNVKVPYGAAKRVFPKVRWMIILLLIGSPFIILIGKILLDWAFVTSPGTIWLEKRTINSIEAGTVEKVFFQKGDMVGPDTVIFRVKRKIQENRREQIALLEAEREAAINGGASEGKVASAEVSGSSEQLELVKQSIAYYETMCNDTRRLMEQGAATRAEVDAAENKLRETKASLAAINAASAKALVNNQATPTVNPMRISQIEQSIKALKSMTEEFFDIKTGQGGKVSSILVNDGQSFSAGEPLAIIVNTESAHIMTYVDPKDLKKTDIGTAAIVKLPGSNRKIKAVVEQPPVVADNVPNGISEKIYPTSMRRVQVFLKLLEPLQEEETIDGLPIVVEW